MSEWYQGDCAVPCEHSRERSRVRQLQLTKPPGSLGQLETIATCFSAWQQREIPALDTIGIRVFAADHGICDQGISAFPAEVTVQMIANFVAGGAAISVLSQDLGADFQVVNMGTRQPVPAAPRLTDISLMPGTRDFSREPAMPEAILEQALAAGREQIDGHDWQLFIGGEMGIGNTTAAAAILAALLQQPTERIVGRGTGIDTATWEHKCDVVAKSLLLHQLTGADPLQVLLCVGGLEIAALCGAFIRCAQSGVPVLVDGFIATAAAVAATRINPGVSGWLLAGHRSAEAGHQLALQSLSLEPILDLGMRLGEGSGAAVAVAVLRSALSLHRNMATFAEAEVSAAGAPAAGPPATA
ncbi:MAG: nicotinate-nucleotide--dimethylbenzimidazole phosphoribosyltransferase [Gammaproteobacteria bacterium]|nr:nicotinate-nucleotide--dimethylbenzimidazole phosphoribosyltransferase [Gammaproteobacteria bacterium]